MSIALPASIYRRSLLQKRKRSRWPAQKKARGPGGRESNPIVLSDEEAEVDGAARAPSPSGSVCTRAYAYDEEAEACLTEPEEQEGEVGVPENREAEGVTLPTPAGEASGTLVHEL